MRILIILVGMLATTGIPLWAAEEPSLSLDQAVRLALAAHPALGASAHEVAAAQAGVRGARALPSPELLVSPAGRVDDAQAAVFQPLALNGQRSAATAAARARLSSAAAQREALRRNVVFRVRTTFYDALAAQQERSVAAETVALLEQIQQAAEKSVDLGNAPESHRLRTRVELTRARQQLRLAEGEVAARLAALNGAMGRDAATPVAIEGELPRPEAIPAAEVLRAAAQGQRPELAAAQAEVRAREADTRAARAGLRPDLVLEAKRASLRSGGGSIGIGFTLPFLDWGQRRSAVRQADAAVQAETARLAQQRNVVTLDVQEALARLEASAKVVESYETGILVDAERLSEMTRTGYQEGALSYLEVLDAQRALVETRQDAIRARNAYANARAALDRAVGAPVQ